MPMTVLVVVGTWRRTNEDPGRALTTEGGAPNGVVWMWVEL
jgi:hypothetical protein